MLRIGIDVTAAVTGSTGIARYVRELARAISSQRESRDDAPSVVQFAIGRGVQRAPTGTRHLPIPLRVVDRFWRSLDAPRIDRLTGSVTSIHASGPLLPPARAPLIAVVHDLAPLDHPELHPARDVAQLRRYVDRLGTAAAVIAGSAATADRLLGEGTPSDRVHVVPYGLSRFPQAVRPPLADRPYILAVGAPVPRKGYDTLLRAMALLSDPGLELALVGPWGPEDDALSALSASLGLGRRFHRIGPVTEAELAGWYGNARALAAPSIEEGFGLTLIEALSFGVPVVVSDIAPFREATGGNATFVPVGDAHALSSALAEAAERPASVMSVAERGARHVERYTWSACAEATIAVHRTFRSP